VSKLYGCETLSLTLREKHTLRVFENCGGENIWAKGAGGRDGSLEKTA
jgi:hypothetical protein